MKQQKLCNKQHKNKLNKREQSRKQDSLKSIGKGMLIIYLEPQDLTIHPKVLLHLFLLYNFQPCYDLLPTFLKSALMSQHCFSFGCFHSLFLVVHSSLKLLQLLSLSELSEIIQDHNFSASLHSHIHRFSAFGNLIHTADLTYK